MKTQKKPVSRVNTSSNFTGSGSSRIADPKTRNPLQDDEDEDELDLNLEDDLEDLNYDFDDEDEY
jgi:hypothetical protein